MIAAVPGRISARKLRLFGVACCRSVWDCLEDERSRQAVDVAEGVAEGQRSESERYTAWLAARAVARRIRNPAVDEPDDYVAACLADAATHAVGPMAAITRVAGALQTARKNGWCPESGGLEVPELLRDIFGNPFRPVAFDAVWRSATATSLAEAIYTERAFDRLPILADALEDAGCTSADVLEPCRSPGPHVRGCWVVDLVLGKE